MDTDSLKVPAERLTAYCDPESLGFETTEEIGPLEVTVGQARAVSALGFGLSVDAPDYNIYVVGYPGSGRATTLGTFLNQAAAKRPVPDDWCYVHNFRDPLQPVAVRLPAGTGRQLVQDMQELIRDSLRDIPQAFESDNYRTRVEESLQEFQQKREGITKEIEASARQEGFIVQPSPLGIVTTPLKDGQPITRERYNQLPEEEKTALREKSEALQSFVDQHLAALRRLEREATKRRTEVDRDVVRAVINPAINELKEKFSDIPALIQYLDDVRQDIAEHVDDFRTTDDQQPQQQTMEAVMAREIADAERFLRYKVNVLVDNSHAQGAPVIFEYSPTYYNLFGRVEYRPRFGTAATDLSMIRPGAIHLASGGYLALQARDVLSSPLVWETLKRVLRSREARIENIGEQFSAIPTATLRPQPIPVQTKIILMGTPMLFNILQRVEEDFRKFFKVKADFDLSMERTPENTRFYASFIRNQSRDAGVRPFHKSAVARLVEYASRLVEHQGKLTTRFIDIADLVTEADHWAKNDGDSRLVTAQHVAKAIKERIYRSNLPEERLQEFFNDGTIKIDTDGAVVGQINGMSVIDMGDYAFGRPIRIIARTALGRGQVSIDREAQMTGRTHNKGFFILTGYVMGKYGQDKPLSFRSSIGFEQTYDEVEGDSASSAELYALLSSLAGIPIQQSIAVTGSVNQRGEIQAIGGAIYKIEGFFDVCKAKGLTGRQGVIIPKDNIRNLVLREDVIQAVRDGLFTVYAVETVEQGIEILTGMPAGEPDAGGRYPEGTLNHAICKNLDHLATKAREVEGRDRDGDSRNGASDQPGGPSAIP
ncbi:MAG: ATP-binding protein [Dehalococcoidia bacterium]|nr:ATP-binding protein [Dehalococcoidia bacterium]